MAAYQFMIKKKRDPKTKAWKTEAFIYLRYSYRETEALFATGRKIDVNYWDEEKGTAKQKYPGNRNSLNKLLTKLKGDVENAESQLMREQGNEFTATEVKERYTEIFQGTPTGPVKADTLWEKFINERAGKIDPRTIRNQHGSRKSFLKFCEEKKKGAITLRKIDKGLIAAYDSWLGAKAENTRAKRMKDFKAFLRSVKHPAMDLIKFKQVPGDKIFLTEPELTAFELIRLDDLLLSQVRDLVLLQCNTGLRVSDLLRLGSEHIQGNDLLIRAKKNDEFIRMPISARVAAIIQKYNGKLPEIDYITYWSSIPKVAKLAIPKSKIEITEHRNGTKKKTTCFKCDVLSSHDFVRTFINLAAARGMPIPSIAALTGKTVATLLKSYLNPSAEQAYQDAQQYERPVMTVNG